MAVGKNCINSTVRNLRVAALLAAFAAPSIAHAGEESGLVFRIAAPAGFESLTTDQTLIVDLYFGGQPLGPVEVKVGNGRLVFLQPDYVAGLVPGAKDLHELSTALARAPLATNAHLVCSLSTDPAQCGRLSPDEVGVILDRDHFRLDLFISPTLLRVGSAREEVYLPPADDTLSLVSVMGGIVSGSLKGRERTLFDFSNRLLVARGESRLIAELGYSSELGLRSEEVMFEIDRPEKRMFAGSFWTRGSDLIAREKILGAGIETQIDTRLDREELMGTPLVVFLSQRSKVDIVRDGRIVWSRVYDAGNWRLDTSGLPDGAYEIILRINEIGGITREETRFFNKSRQVPAMGRDDFFAVAGLRLDPLDINSAGDPYFEAGWARRISNSFAVDIVGTAVGDNFAIQAGTTYVLPVGFFRVALLATSDGTTGGLIQVGSGGFSRLNYNVDFRRIESNPTSSSLANPAPLVVGPAQDWRTNATEARASFSQAVASVSYSSGNFQFLGSAYYRKDDGEVAAYGAGPSIRWELLQREGLRFAVNGNATATDRGNVGYLGFSISLVDGKRNLSAHAGARQSSIAGEASGLVGSLAGSWREPGVLGGDLDMGAQFEREPNSSTLSAGSHLRTRALSLNGDLVSSNGAGRSQIYYNAAAQTQLAIGRGSVALEGRNATDSVVISRVSGARQSDRFEVLVNEAVAGEIVGSGSLQLALSPYYSYQLRLRATGSSLLSYDVSSRQIGLYPGNVHVEEWNVRPIRVVIGRLVSDDGFPLPAAHLKSSIGLAETDVHGNFQIEVVDNEPLEVLMDGMTHRVPLPELDHDNDWTMMGDLRCCSKTSRATVRLSQFEN